MPNCALRSKIVSWLPTLGMLCLVGLGLALGGSALAAEGDPYGGNVQYREMFPADSAFGFLNARVIIWMLL